MLDAGSAPIRTLEDLKRFVNQVLCARDQLVLGAFQMTERLLLKAGKPCGLFFCLHGPRAVKLTAIWDAANNVVLFYSSSGERFHKTQLDEGLDVELAVD